ncbi:apoptosis-associated speck-like protein containing a CARD [Scomber scombrus]|uniref:Apoptosis-associated speck-like protein containing a CARD n=1 Tax=Scomber scombrus TaxID=13677 RepID=A0AAV1NH61_SCOSC|nr:apoptosis-associated speck-like protein containing a CARD isoform X2 [Scomber scombrus]
MAPKTIKMALSNMLADLKKDDLAKFCSQLVDRREEPRVRRNRVEGKSFLEIADVLVSAFTEQGALDVATEILNDIDCQNDAKNLAEDTRELTSKSGSTGNKHFVDKHKVELIQRVSNTDSILDGLFDHDVIPQEVYDKIRAVPTTQARVRELYCGPLKAGQECKNVFYKLLEQHEKFLVEDLKKKA